MSEDITVSFAPADAKAPWTTEQVVSLNGYQRARVMHPFTCGNRGDARHAQVNSEFDVLVATVNGWICPFCDWKQDWAHDFMANGAWREIPVFTS